MTGKYRAGRLAVCAIAPSGLLFVLTACTIAGVYPGPRDQVSLPITYEAEPIPGPSGAPAIPEFPDETWSSTWVTLFDDGHASFSRMPAGTISHQPEGQVCVKSSKLISGEGSWRNDTRGHVFITVEDREIYLGARNARFDVDWSSVVTRICKSDSILNLAPGLFHTRDE